MVFFNTTLDSLKGRFHVEILLYVTNHDDFIHAKETIRIFEVLLYKVLQMLGTFHMKKIL